MMKSITRTMLTRAMCFAWDIIRSGERIVEACESWEAEDQHAGLVEMSMWKVGTAFTAGGERLELWVNGLAVRFGYNDGEVSGMVAGSLTLAC